MRPVKQAGVVLTHCLLFFAPAASVGAGAGLLVTHVTRFAFLFLSAAMLVYAYPTIRRGDLRRFWRRRLGAVAAPYLTWTVIYFALQAAPIPGVPAEFRPSGTLGTSLPADLSQLGQLVAAGYYQLYYLVLLLQFYLLYPAFSWLLHRTSGHHRTLLGCSVALQLLLTGLVHWAVLPGWMLGYGANRELWNYQLFVVAGGLLAFHYAEVHAWLLHRGRAVIGWSALSVAVAMTCYVLAVGRIVPALAGTGADGPFQPVTVPLFLGLTACTYLLGVALTDERRPARLRTAVASAADNSYGVYLSQVLFILGLTALGWGHLDSEVPWPVVTVGAATIVYLGGLALTATLARLPGARATTGRARVHGWRPPTLPPTAGPTQLSAPRAVPVGRAPAA